MHPFSANLCVLAAAWGCLLASTSASSLDATYPVNWGLVPGPENKNLSANCICDLTPGVCDTACCCDQACSVVVVNTTRSQGRCLPEGPPPQTLDFCVRAGFVQQVNLPSSSDFFTVSITTPTSENRALDHLLCIVDSANPDLGEQYANPPAGPVGDNAALARCPQPPTVPSRPRSYQFNTPVFVRGTGGQLQPLGIPYPALSSECSDEYVVGFLQGIPANLQQDVFSTCTRTGGVRLQQLCRSGTPLSPSYFDSFVYPDVPQDSGSDVAEEIEALLFDPVSGTTSSVPPDTDATLQGSTCLFAVRHINYTFLYSQEDSSGLENKITGVIVSLGLIDADMTEPFTQSVRVTFLRATSRDELVLQQNSGNPGYLAGFPLLAGRLVDDPDGDGPQAVARFIHGFPVPAAGRGGGCDAWAGQPARFGSNTSSTCFVELDASDLEQECNSNAGTPQKWLEDYLGDAFQALINDRLVFGIWGNSNWTVTDEWVQATITGFAQAAPLQYAAGTRTCSNVITGFDMQVLTGLAFAANNVQRKVLFVNICLRTSTWTFPANRDLSSDVRFPLSSRVTFVALDQEPEGSRKPAPPLVVPLPEDIFYPFITTGALPPAAAPLLLISMMAALALVVLL